MNLGPLPVSQGLPPGNQGPPPINQGLRPINQGPPALNNYQPSNEQVLQIGKQLGDLVGAMNSMLMLLQSQYMSFPPPNYPYQR